MVRQPWALNIVRENDDRDVQAESCGFQNMLYYVKECTEPKTHGCPSNVSSYKNYLVSSVEPIGIADFLETCFMIL